MILYMRFRVQEQEWHILVLGKSVSFLHFHSQ